MTYKYNEFFSNEIQEKMRNKDIYIWGAWERGELVLSEMISQGFTIKGFIDSKKFGQTFGNPVTKVYSAEILDRTQCFVIVALAEHSIIFDILNKMGFVEYENFVYFCKHVELENVKHNYLDFYRNQIIGDISDAKVSISGGSQLIIGKNVKFEKGVKIILDWKSKIIIKDNAYIAKDTIICALNQSYIELGNKIEILENSHIRVTGLSSMTIGDNCKFGIRLILRMDHQSKFICGDDCLFSYDIKIRANQGHSIFDLNQKMALDEKKFCKIGNHVWIGMGVTLLPGTDIGDNCVVGAESLVNKQFCSNKLIVGTPAKVLRENIDWSYDELSYDEYFATHINDAEILND